VLCYDPATAGAHELWWVQRSRRGGGGGGGRRIVERRLPFAVISPLCDWDAVNDRYLPYATLPGALPLAGQPPPPLLFSRPRTGGTPGGRPGIGMGATLLPHSRPVMT
jgi:hypothetical protein